MRLQESVLVVPQREPMGIVIADGGPGDRPSRFAAFVWGPVPEDEVVDTVVLVPELAKVCVAAC